ncbi:hypothetical protein L6164_025988 [Bauhinia variegata]|uniref:Uncharacterized protein n=1 Tax=Bauhinia variegata TaxID=167791 RepID=A0ACB9M4C3_BAUVA|nr:hypothetical protein L6164_025988 [Bauhinia variegata]
MKKKKKNAVSGLGSGSTIAVTYVTATVCGIIAGEPTQRIQCYQNGQNVPVLPNSSYQAISGGRSFFCGLRNGGLSLHCWDTALTNSSFQPKRLYYSKSTQLTDLTVGDAQVCAREVNSGIARCWRGNGYEFPSPGEAFRFRSITSGSGFSCGILKVNYRVWCWGQREIAGEIHKLFENLSMSSLVAGESHVCGLTTNGALICKGNNDSGQLNVIFSSTYEFSGLALGANFTCAVRPRNGMVVCWGGTNRFEFDSDMIKDVSFESIVAGLDFVCGITTKNLSMFCWGPGWSGRLNLPSDLPLGVVLPGPCVEDSCSNCGTYPNSEALCHGSGSICYSCQTEMPLAVPLPPLKSPPLSPQGGERNTKELLAFLIVGSIGSFVGLCTILYCLWSRLLKRNVENSAQPTSSEAYVDVAPPIPGFSEAAFRSFSSKRQNSRTLRRSHRSGSSTKITDKTQSFSLSELAAATNNFSKDNQIGAGSFGVVYKGQLTDGQDVAIKRGETSTKMKKFQDKESAFDSELVLLSRLHHKHLVGLIGFCEENDERLLVYEYMSNGSLHDHLHDKRNTEKSSSILNSWKIRIKIALDAARGIEYLHNYAVPPIIHRDIKSSNILLDSKWNARVSDFGLSLLIGSESEESTSTIIKAAGTVGYIDPEYYVLNVLTTKSDVYGLGVVMLELLTGKRAVFQNGEAESGPIGVVEFAKPRIAAGEIWKVLDYRVGEPEVNEIEALELMALTAMHCVSLEGKDRPCMADIVANLEKALAFHEGNLDGGRFSVTSYSASFE